MATGFSSTTGRSQAGGVPSTSTFSFKAPFPVSPASAVNATALKHRRVSLASPSSPRIVKPFSFRDEMGLQSQASEDAASTTTAAATATEKPTPPIDTLPEKKGKMRKIDTTQNSDESTAPTTEKKPRKKWSSEETQMLVDGCNKHGVGNWKTILQDPEYTFRDRSAVDLKDRFRTYFPDAYKKHYPNARTHLSSKIRSTFADGSSLFEKTRSKRRRPFTEAEDRALKAGYEKHGTTWATIVKDPIFQEQNRRSTDLRDRFRNAFPTLYQAAGYKPRTATKKKAEGGASGTVRAADDQLTGMTTAGPVRSRRRAHTSQGFLRGGTKSVPQSTACSEDEDSSAGEEESESSQIFKTPPTPVFVDGNHDFRASAKRPAVSTSISAPAISTSASAPAPAPAADNYIDADDEMELITIDTDPLNIPDFLPNNAHSDMETWSSGINTPTHSSTAAWSTAAASPTSSHVSDFFMNSNGNGNGNSNSASNASSPFIHRRNDISGNNLGMIGKSAWGTNDWFSPNPRLESSASNSSTSSSSFIDSSSFSPASPFSFHPHLNHGVLDRYDLFPPYMPDSGSSEAGYGDTHTTFSDDFGGGSGANGTGGSYHSQIAGDLISGGARMHQSNSFSSLMPLSSMYGSAFGNGPNGEGSGLGLGLGLGLEGIPENAGIHPMQLHSHSIDELGLTGISLNDRTDSSSAASTASGGMSQNADANVNVNDAMDDGTRESGGDGDEDEDMVAMAFGLPRSPEKLHHRQQQQQMKEEEDRSEDLDSSLNSAFRLDDLVDLHSTPPATPVLTQPRPLRRSSGGPMMHSFDSPYVGNGGGGHHARSISVPPSEARNGYPNGGIPMSMDDVGLHSMHATHQDLQSDFMNASARTLHSFFNPHLSSPISGNGHDQGGHHRHKTSEPMRLSNSTGSLHPPMSPILRHQPPQNNSNNNGSNPQQQQQQQSSGTVYPGNLLLSPSSRSALPPSSSTDTFSDNAHSMSMAHSVHLNEHSLNNDLWRNVFPSSGDSYNLSFLDLHTYYVHGHGHGGQSHLHNGLGGVDVTLDDHSEMRQGLALDLAQSAASSSSLGGGLWGGSNSNLSLGLSLRGFNPSPVGTIRQRTGAGREKTPIPSFVAPSQTVSTVNGELSVLGIGVPPNDSTVLRNLGAGREWSETGKASQARSGGGALGRSMSHHRGQSAVCPQDLMLRSDNKRKRASWDGGVA